MKPYAINLCLMLLLGMFVGFFAVKRAAFSSGPESAAEQSAAGLRQTRTTRANAPNHGTGLQRDTVGDTRETIRKMARMLESGFRETSQDILTPPLWRDEIPGMLDWMGEDDVIDALEHLDEVTTNGQISHKLLVMLSQHFARMDGQRAMEYALSMPAEPHGTLVSSFAFNAWADYDAQNAMTWVLAQASSDQASVYSEKNAYYTSRAHHELREIDTRQAYARLHEILDPLNDSYMDLSARDPEIRNDIIASLKYLPTESKFKTMRMLLDQWASEDPKAAADFALSQDLSLDRKDHVRLGLASGWAEQDPQKTLNWLVHHPSASESDTTLLTIYCAWLRHWPEEARGWLQQTDPEIRTLLNDSDPNLEAARNIADIMRVAREKRERETPGAP